MKRRAFTLVELLISIAVLLIILVATSRIFSATSKVARIGEATIDIKHTAAMIERSIRRDLRRLARDGVMAIQCVAVRNDVNRLVWSNAQAPRLDPTRAPLDYLRCDQVVFFARGVEVTRQYIDSGFGSVLSPGEQRYFTVNLLAGPSPPLTGEQISGEQMIRYGHGLQFAALIGDARSVQFPDAFTMPYGSGVGREGPLVPWSWQPPGLPQMKTQLFNRPPVGSPPRAHGAQPSAIDWTLARQMVLLADDGGPLPQQGPIRYRDQAASGYLMNSAPSIVQRREGVLDYADSNTYSDVYRGLWVEDGLLFPDRVIAASRVDIAATSIARLKQFFSNGRGQRPMPSDPSAVWTGGSRLPWTAAAVPAAVTPQPSGRIRDRVRYALFGAALPQSGFSTEGLWGWPRSERSPPTTSPYDIMTTVSTMAGGCSWFQVDWSWDDRTGQMVDRLGTPRVADAPVDSVNSRRIRDVPLAGLMLARWPKASARSWLQDDGSDYSSRVNDVPVESDLNGIVPWFGIPDILMPASQRTGVTMLGGALPDSKARPLATVLSPSDAPSYAAPIRLLDLSKSSVVLAGDGRPQEAGRRPAGPEDLVTVGVLAPPLDAERIEGEKGLIRPMGPSIPVYLYQAIFGFNPDQPTRQVSTVGGGDQAARTVAGPPATPSVRAVRRELRSDYTPWPSALRFTFILHDSGKVFQRGQTFRFVVKLDTRSEP